MFVLPFRTMLLFTLTFLSVQLLAYTPTAVSNYDYDAVEYFIADRNIESEAENSDYDDTPSLRYCCSAYLNSDSHGKARIRFFFALIGDFVVTKGLADPKTIRFSQCSIKGIFRDGRSAQDLAAGLKNGSIKPGDVPAIRIVQRNGQTVSIDIRRLVAFWEL